MWLHPKVQCFYFKWIILVKVLKMFPQCVSTNTLIFFPLKKKKTNLTLTTLYEKTKTSWASRPWTCTLFWSVFPLSFWKDSSWIVLKNRELNRIGIPWGCGTISSCLFDFLPISFFSFAFWQTICVSNRVDHSSFCNWDYQLAHCNKLALISGGTLHQQMIAKPKPNANTFNCCGRV